MLIGLTGRNASGKSTLVDWFAAKGLRSVSCSDSIRSWLAEKGVESTREALIEGGRELRREGGPGILAEMLLGSLEGADAVVDSIRTPAEVAALRSRDDFVLIEVRADEDLRWQRLQRRARSGDPSDRGTFVAQEKAEAEAEDEAGQALDATASMADFQVLNDGTISDLLNRVEQLWSEL
ncbi:MAG: AAA family ATPase [Candidatus Thermoplasmatota archaeon]|nr:AAA family ATPase [Candidatus Thermoplasmatota archaeon]MEE2651056.1 AAA family ATPase [Candidatus Thermoplasmatota archaeon]|tara:strand:+ start:1848 stop:2387 length:540 start_codon:yes stop_codon:yes gene_type:complete